MSSESANRGKYQGLGLLDVELGGGFSERDNHIPAAEEPKLVRLDLTGMESG